MSIPMTEFEGEGASAVGGDRGEEAESPIQLGATLQERPELLKALAVRVLEDLPGELLDLEIAVNGGSWREVEERSHRIGGRLLVLGARRGAEESLRLESCVREGRFHEAPPTFERFAREARRVEVLLKNLFPTEG